MKSRVSLVLLVLLAAAPLVAQVPKGWMYRVDRSMSAADPDAPGSIKLTPTGSGFHAVTPQAAVFWNPANTAAGSYTLKATFTLIKDEGDNEYYGLIFGGSGLDGPAQQYLYFMVTDDGTWLVKHRSGSSAESVSNKTASPAVKKPGPDGTSTNTLEVRVMPDKIAFVVNGAVVSTMPKSGATAKTDGIYGLRVNHHLEVQIDGLAVTKQ